MVRLLLANGADAAYKDNDRCGPVRIARPRACVTDSDAQPTADDVNCAQHTTCKLACNEHATCNTVTAKPAPCNMIRRRLRFAHRHRCAVRPRGTMLMTRPRLMRRPRSAFVSHVV
jgi:hypothetical protein